MKVRHRTAATVALLLCLLSGRFATADPIDDLVQTQLESSNTPGVALLVMQNGTIIKQRGYGYANLELRVPVTPDTLFQSGSTGKMFTAVGILLLAQDGKLKLDDPVAMYFPQAPAAWHRISIRQLLTHTSGIQDYDTNPGVLDYHKDYTDEELLAVMERLPLDFEPGTQWMYSNSGYIILGLLITKVAGEHWSDFLTERLFKPLGMQTAQVISERKITANRAAGYQLDEHGAVGNQDWVAPALNRQGDGSLYFSLRDLAAWEKALEARSFMSEQSFTDWWTAARLVNGTRHPYGFGWVFAEQRGQPVMFHGGGWQGFSTRIVRYPEQRLAIMILANSAEFDPDELAQKIAGLVDRRLEIQAPTGLQRVANESLANSLRTVLEAWASYRTVPAMAPSLAATETGTVTEAKWRQAFARALRATHALRVIDSYQLSKPAMALMDDGTVTVVDTVLETDNAPLPVKFTLDKNGRVVWLEMSH